MGLALIARSFNEECNTKQKEQTEPDDYDGSFFCREIVGIVHGKQIIDTFKVCKAKRCYTVWKDASVNDSKEHPETADNDPPECTSAEQINKA